MTADLESQLNDADLELLSAYIDRQLSPAEISALERRLETDQALSRALAELRATVDLLHDLPPARPPRSFTIGAQAAHKQAWSFPWRQLGSALVAMSLLIAFGFVLARTGGRETNSASAPLAAAAPTAAPAAPEAPASAAGGAPIAEGVTAAAPAVATAAPAEAAPMAPEASAPPGVQAPMAAEAAPTMAAAAAAPSIAEQPTAATVSDAAGATLAGPSAEKQASPEVADSANATGGAPSTAFGAATPAPAGGAGGTVAATSVPFIARSATSASAARELQAPTPAAEQPSSRPPTLGLLGIVLLIIAVGGLILLFARRQR